MPVDDDSEEYRNCGKSQNDPDEPPLIPFDTTRAACDMCRIMAGRHGQKLRGTGGQNRKSVAEHAANGNPGKRKHAPDPIKVAVDWPPPDYLTEPEKLVWNATIATYGRCDPTICETYCHAAVAERTLAGRDLTVSKNLKEWMATAKLCREFAAELSRSVVKQAPEKPRPMTLAEEQGDHMAFILASDDDEDWMASPGDPEAGRVVDGGWVAIEAAPKPKRARKVKPNGNGSLHG